jgi:putative RNA 2'-phosphotransferase
MQPNLLGLSRFLALLLRHKGPEMGLEFDDQGFTSIRAVLDLLGNNDVFSWTTRKDLDAVVNGDSKGRYEIRKDRIRARYGHSGSIRVIYEAVEPPGKLYHGTTGQAIMEIQRKGLLPRERNFVHLSLDEKTAYDVGRRRVAFPVVLEIDAATAYKDGVEFFHPSQHIILVREMPPKYLKLMQVPNRRSKR